MKVNMDIQNKTVLVLGAWGLVGNAITRKLVIENPKKIIIASLQKKEALEQVENMRKEFPNLTPEFLEPIWGNIFFRTEHRNLTRNEILSNSEYRKLLLDDTLEELNKDIIKKSYLYEIIKKHKPDIIIDCINTATAISSQDIYSSYKDLKNTFQQNPTMDMASGAIEKLLCTMYIPQLIRHIQILYNSMKQFTTKLYIKVGTSGTGGMGFNIPYVNSEEKPSRIVLSKSAVAGAHTLLLFLMGRTPDAPITKEIKPAAAAAWKKIVYDVVHKRGKPIELIEVPKESLISLKDELNLTLEQPYKSTGEKLRSVYIDTGENGIFSRGEFEAISAQRQMEFVTPEEIAQNIIYEIKGGNTGRDIINALDNASLQPSYRAGYMQHFAVEKMSELERMHDIKSVSFEITNSTRMSKLLYEIHLIKLIVHHLNEIPNVSPKQLGNAISDLIRQNDRLRNEILSLGLAVLLPDGKSLYRGNQLKVPKDNQKSSLTITDKNIDKWSFEGWIDLRTKNLKLWQSRVSKIMLQAESIGEEDTSSLHVRTKHYWNNFERIDIGKVVSWIFINEDNAKRMKG